MFLFRIQRYEDKSDRSQGALLFEIDLAVSVAGSRVASRVGAPVVVVVLLPRLFGLLH